MSQTLEQQVQLLMDKWEIEKVLARYCRAIDRTDMELLKSVYHPDGIDNHGVFTGNAMEFAEFIIPHPNDGKVFAMDDENSYTMYNAIDAETMEMAFQVIVDGRSHAGWGSRVTFPDRRASTTSGE